MYKCKLITLVVFVMLLGMTINSLAQKSENQHIIMFQKSKVVLHKTARFDSSLIEDPVTGAVKTVLVPIYKPVSVNTMKVRKELPPYMVSNEIQKNIIPQLESYFTSLAFPDGTIRLRLRNIVVSEKGELVYYELESVQLSQASDHMIRAIMGETFALQAVKESVGLLRRRLHASYTLLTLDFFNCSFIVKNGKATFVH